MLLETHVTEGKLTCGNCGHSYMIKEGIANFLLPSHLGEKYRLLFLFCSLPVRFANMRSLSSLNNTIPHALFTQIASQIDTPGLGTGFENQSLFLSFPSLRKRTLCSGTRVIRYPSQVLLGFDTSTLSHCFLRGLCPRAMTRNGKQAKFFWNWYIVQESL